MKNILVANAGSSSVKFQVFAVDGSGKLARMIKGQMNGIGTRVTYIGTGQPSCSLRYSDRRGIYDRAPYIGSSSRMRAVSRLVDSANLSN